MCRCRCAEVRASPPDDRSTALTVVCKRADVISSRRLIGSAIDGVPERGPSPAAGGLRRTSEQARKGIALTGRLVMRRDILAAFLLLLLLVVPGAPAQTERPP